MCELGFRRSGGVTRPARPSRDNTLIPNDPEAAATSLSLRWFWAPSLPFLSALPESGLSTPVRSSSLVGHPSPHRPARGHLVRQVAGKHADFFTSLNLVSACTGILCCFFHLQYCVAVWLHRVMQCYAFVLLGLRCCSIRWQTCLVRLFDLLTCVCVCVCEFVREYV